MDNKFGVVTRAVVILDRFGHVLQTDLRKKFNQAPQRFAQTSNLIYSHYCYPQLPGLAVIYIDGPI